MSHTTPTSSTTRTSKMTRLANGVRNAWADARYADRRLMEIRTSLSRHSG